MPRSGDPDACAPRIATWDADAQPAPDPGGWVWHPESWESAGLESVQDARDRTRGQAAMRFARDDGWLLRTEVAVWKRHARALTIQEQWEHYCDDRGWYEDDPDGEDGSEREMADTPSAGWRPDPWDEDMPVWRFCLADEEGAVPVWVCGLAGWSPPHNPARRAVGSR